MGSHLTLARAHVEKGREIVARQRVLIGRIRALRADPTQAEDLLAQFERTLKVFEDDLAHLEQTG
jgi:hypothetical protein